MGRTFASLQNERFRILWFGTLFSFLGMQMQVIARGYLAFDLTGKNSALGLVMLSFGIPQLFLGLWGGVLADRLPKRTVLFVAQIIIALNSAWVAVMIEMDRLEFWMLVFAGVVQGAGFAFVGPARQAYIGDLVGKEHIANAVVLQQMSMNSTRVVGPSIAGAFIAVSFIGAGGVYAMTTLGFLVACVTLFWLPPGEPRADRPKRSPLADMWDGLGYVRRRPAILNLILTSFLVVMIGFPYQAFLPSVASEVYNTGPGGLGAMSSATAVGAVVMTVLVAAYGDGRRAWQFATAMGVIFGASMIAFGLSHAFWQGLLVLVLVGGFAAGFQSLNNSLTMMITDSEYNGRVQSMTMLSWSLFGIASLPLGMIADVIGIQETLMIMGGVSVLGVLALQLHAKAKGAAADRTRLEGREEAGTVPAAAGR